MNKSLVKKGAIVVGVLILFFAFLQYRDYKNTHFTVDQDTFKVKDSLGAVMKDVYVQNPELEPAIKYGIAVNVDKEVPLVSERRELKVDKVWLNLGGIYIFYNVNLLKVDQSLDNIPELEVGKVIFHRNNGPDFSADVNPDNFGKPRTFKETYDYHVYQQYIKGFNYNNIKIDGGFEKNFLEHVTSITLSDVKMVVKKKKTAIEDIKFPASFNIDKYLVKTIPINKTIVFGGVKVQLKNYKKYYNHGELNYDTVSGQSLGNIVNVVTNVKLQGGSKVQNWGTDEDIPRTFIINEGKQYFPNIEAKSMTITPIQYGFIDKKPITIHIDKETMVSLDRHPGSEKKVADIKNGSIYISLNHASPGFNLIFKYNETKFPHVGDMNWMTTSDLQALSDTDKKTIAEHQRIIDIKDGNGHLLRTIIPQASTTDYGTSTYSFGGQPIDWFNFSGLDITLQSLVYVNKITTEPITIPLGK